MARTVLVGGTVVTVDADRRVLDPGAVAVDGDAIVAVGPREQVLAEHPDADRIDLADHVLLPGLVDSHGHAGHSLTKNLADGAGDDWLDLVKEIYFEATGTPFWRAEGRLAALERLRAGVTTSLSYVGSMPRVDDPRFAAAAATGYREFGLRHVVAVGPPDGLPVDCADPEAGTETTVDLDRAMATTGAVVDDLHGNADGRIQVAVAPSSLVPEMDEAGNATEASVDQLRRVTEFAEREDLAIHAHAYEGEIAAADAADPEVLTERLSLAHCAGIDSEEVALMAENGVAASHGPLTHAYAWDRFPVVEAMEQGVTVAVSTDGSAPDRSFDLLSQGRIAAQLQRAHHGDTSLLPAGRVLEAMTVDAAAALGLGDEVGSLTPGKRADVVAIDRRSAKLGPHLDTGQTVPRLVNYADGGDVSFVMADGAVRLRDGAVVAPEAPTVEAVLDDAAAAAGTALDRVDAADALEPHPDLWGAVRYGE
ncbi:MULTISPECIES: amidohydrolase family protein [Halolamina]|uniref:Cytosine/adenosine deaminase n=1 Tax=Halolamina pelagica TaxID=699431 RepID=A0A1I5TF53_9EURY|nr:MULTISPECIES: amidohydrolase family protein [Halolamina]NHX37321.1 amidohydrolase family protein [Halolamina sp. R1-12]SFP81674.1 Cytosine/adenosine deaminase [Halolamina pelagica]